MDQYDVRRLALILACQAEIDAMKAENAIRESQGDAPAYGEKHFQACSGKLLDLARMPNELLINY